MATDVKIENKSGVNVDGLKGLLKPNISISMLCGICCRVMCLCSGDRGYRDGVCVANIS